MFCCEAAASPRPGPDMTDAIAAPLPASARAGAKSFARVEVYETVAAAAAVWAEMEAVAPASVYQTRRWLEPWLAHVGAARGERPMLVAAFDEAGRPVAFLPLTTNRCGLHTVAAFAGGKDANFNLPLMRPGAVLDAADCLRLLRAARCAAPARPNLFLLANQPLAWEGIANPLAQLPRQASASFGWKTALAADGAGLLRQKLSKDGAKKLARKERRLADLGPLRYFLAQGPEEVAAAIDAFLAQKVARLHAMGVTGVFESAGERMFLLAAATPGPDGAAAMSWFALSVAGRIAATYAGGVHRGRFHGMVNSFDASPQFAIASPGELLMKWLLAECCARGLATLDMGVGEAQYKQAWCGEAEPLFDCFIPVGLVGRLGSASERLRGALKRWIKQTPWAWALAKRVRAGR